MNNNKSKELAHWAIGEMLKGHKYIAREDAGANRKSKYIYFYAKEKWDKWKENVKSAADKVSSSISSAVNEFKSNYWNGLPSGVKNKIAVGKSVLSGMKESYKEAYKFGAQQIMTSANRLYYNSVLKSVVDRASDKLGFSKPQHSNVIYRASYEGVHIPDENSKFKYVGKITMPNGKVRYYYDWESFKRGVEIYNYQKNEPSFMNKVKEIDYEDKPPTRDEDMYPINTVLDENGERIWTIERLTNCQYCTLAYELRRRGYDVKAVEETCSTYESQRVALFGIKFKSANNSYCEVSRLTAKKYLDSESGGKFVKQVQKADGTWAYYLRNTVPNHAEDDTTKVVNISEIASRTEWLVGSLDKIALDKFENEAANAIIDKIKEYPPGSRGDMTVWWELGGGHAINWERDSNGEVKIFDCQHDEYIYSSDSGIADLRNMMSSLCTSNQVTFVRYDDKDIVKEGILNYVEEVTKN